MVERRSGWRSGLLRRGGCRLRAKLLFAALPAVLLACLLAATAGAASGSFVSSDPLLNSIWQASVLTASDMVAPGPLTVDAEGRPCAIDLPEVLLDGSDRDRCPYVIDQAVTGLTLLVSTPGADAGVLHDMILWYAQNQHADGSLPVSPFDDGQDVFADSNAFWVEDLYDYVLYTGDVGLAEQVWPNLVALLNTWYPAQTGANGLFVNPFGPFDYAYIPRFGTVIAYYNAVYARALELAADIAGWAGQPAQAQAWQARAAALAAPFNAAFWDPQAHAYMDSTVPPIVHPEDGNVFAILAGFASQTQARQALSYLSYHDNGPFGATIADNDAWDGYPWGDQASQRVYPFISYFELLARFATGLDVSAVDLIRREWGHMIAPGEPGTMWETINAEGTAPIGVAPSWDHGWSSGAAPALTNEVLGLAPATPGFATFSAAPHPSGLLWARGTVPIPQGSIELSWRRSPSAFTATIVAPVPGSFTLPVSGQVTLDGRALTLSPGSDTVALSPGSHHLVVRLGAAHQPHL